jgi:hypothetical protein
MEDVKRVRRENNYFGTTTCGVRMDFNVSLTRKLNSNAK